MQSCIQFSCHLSTSRLFKTINGRQYGTQSAGRQRVRCVRAANECYVGSTMPRHAMTACAPRSGCSTTPDNYVHASITPICSNADYTPKYKSNWRFRQTEVCLFKTHSSGHYDTLLQSQFLQSTAMTLETFGWHNHNVKGSPAAWRSFQPA
jgi:hypothetical protein